MFKRLGIENSLDGVIFLSLILLVAIAPLGSEATHPIVLGLYRTLLILILLVSTIRTRQYELPQVCFLFLGCVRHRPSRDVRIRCICGPGSHFEGIYNFYQNALFLGGLRQPGQLPSNAERLNGRAPYWHWWWSSTWCTWRRHGSMARHGPPLMGPFVNPNYFASYLLVGFAVCVAGVLVHSRRSPCESQRRWRD